MCAYGVFSLSFLYGESVYILNFTVQSYRKASIIKIYFGKIIMITEKKSKKCRFIVECYRCRIA